jgi:hypothetical protein
MMKLQHIDTADKQFFIASILIPLCIWWFFTGRKKYSTKGMK